MTAFSVLDQKERDPIPRVLLAFGTMNPGSTKMKFFSLGAATLLGVSMLAPTAEAHPFGFHGHHHGFYGHHSRLGANYGYGFRRYGRRHRFRPVAAAAGFGLGLAAAAFRAATYPAPYYPARPYYPSYRYAYAPAWQSWYGYQPIAYDTYYQPAYGEYFGWGF